MSFLSFLILCSELFIPFCVLRFHLSSLMFLSIYPGWEYRIWDMVDCLRVGGVFLFVGVFFWWKGRQKWDVRCLISTTYWFPYLSDFNGRGLGCTRCTCCCLILFPFQPLLFVPRGTHDQVRKF